jgi:hypothetical protein
MVDVRRKTFPACRIFNRKSEKKEILVGYFSKNSPDFAIFCKKNKLSVSDLPHFNKKNICELIFILILQP